MQTPKLKIIIIFLVIFFGVFSLTKSSLASTINAVSCSQADVQTAINSANDGDTVKVPVGNCIWITTIVNTPAVKINSKAITLKGSGTDQTIITDATGDNWGEDLLGITGADGKPFRVTELTLTGYSGQAKIAISGTCRNFRIDHCKIEGSSTQKVYGITTTGYTYGVIDHCIFNNARNDWGNDGDASWQRPLGLGTAEAVYIEDNIFTITVYGNINDAWRGGRYVFRHNIVDGSGSGGTGGWLEAHSGCPNGNRGTFKNEIYNNTIIAPTTACSYSPMGIRAGTGVIFNNNITGCWNEPNILVDDQRTCQSDCNFWPKCDGTSIYDGNTPGLSGYPCRDQIGRGTDSGIATPQALEPLYEWNNTLNGFGDIDIKISPVVCAETALHIQEGRDFYNDTPRPSYAPYTYPHPFITDCVNYPMLCDSVDTTPPAAPTGVTVS